LLTIAAVILLGFFLGMRHALDPDHVIAITTIVSRQGAAARAALIGMMWGLGHTFTIFIVGTAIILFNVVIPPRLGLAMELAVGAMLILLGVLNLTGTLQLLQDRFTHHEPAIESPDQNSAALSDSKLARMSRGLGAYNMLRPLVVGIVHGLAGSAAVALLVLTTIRDPWAAIAYLLVFGVGTIAGMMLITAVISKPFIHTARRSSRWNRGMTLASGLLSLGFGLFLSYQIGFVDGLFTSHPHWTPK
jgi:high-affinity nickel permease